MEEKFSKFVSKNEKLQKSQQIFKRDRKVNKIALSSKNDSRMRTLG